MTWNSCWARTIVASLLGEPPANGRDYWGYKSTRSDRSAAGTLTWAAEAPYGCRNTAEGLPKTALAGSHARRADLQIRTILGHYYRNSELIDSVGSVC